MEIRNSIKEIKHKEVLNSAEEERIQTSQKKRFLRWDLMHVCPWLMNRLEFGSLRSEKSRPAQPVNTLR